MNKQYRDKEIGQKFCSSRTMTHPLQHWRFFCAMSGTPPNLRNTLMSEQKKKRGFAALDPERMRQIASSGGVARKRVYDSMHSNGRQTQRDGTSLPRPTGDETNGGSR